MLALIRRAGNYPEVQRDMKSADSLPLQRIHMIDTHQLAGCSAESRRVVDSRDLLFIRPCGHPVLFRCPALLLPRRTSPLRNISRFVGAHFVGVSLHPLSPSRRVSFGIIAAPRRVPLRHTLAAGAVRYHASRNMPGQTWRPSEVPLQTASLGFKTRSRETGGVHVHTLPLARARRRAQPHYAVDRAARA